MIAREDLVWFGSETTRVASGEPRLLLEIRIRT